MTKQKLPTFDYVDTPEKLYSAVEEMGKSKVLAIDIECENNLHHYGSYISLIQISSKEKNWIIDVISTIKTNTDKTDPDKLNSLKELFHNSKVQKIFHDISFDLRILSSQFGIHPKNIFDTQLAAQFVGITELGLGTLLDKFFDVKKEKKFQMVDWTKRPLTKDMLDYAIKDTLYLIQLRDILIKKLQEKKRMEWVKEEMNHLETIQFEYQEGTFSSAKGFRDFSDHQRAVFKRLYDLREKLAKKVDRPVHFIINTKKLVEFSLHPPKWSALQGVHPIVRRKNHLFENEIKKSKGEKLIIPKKQIKHFSIKQREFYTELEEKRIKIAERENLPRHLFLNQEQMKEITLTGKYGCLRNWQKELLSEEK